MHGAHKIIFPKTVPNIKMIPYAAALAFLLVYVSSDSVEAYVESVAGSVDPDLGHFQPMVALLCGHGRINNQYLAEGQRWVSDPDPKAVCSKDKLSILEYCRKVYPKRDIRNIVESSRYYHVDGWCKVGQRGRSCRGSHWVKPYRCLEGDFQSDALLVPEHCLFDHIHNQSVCQSFDDWNQTAAHSCQGRSMRLRSFAMLLPCGVDIFSGVEFVCCPTEGKSSKEEGKGTSSEEDEDYDDYSSVEEEEETTSTTPSTTTSTTPGTTTERPVDHYFSHFDSKHEHDSFKEAQRNLEEGHREKVTKVMKEWSELEEHYQTMKHKDPKGAEDFRKKMSARFQKTVEALEEEGAAEKRQLAAMHQQRVLTIINMRKKSAMDCYTAALYQVPPKTKKIEKCLEKLLRALEKDRTHAVHHYRHGGGGGSPSQRSALLQHLANVDRVANQSLALLDRAPSVADKVRPRMAALWHSLRGRPSDNEQLLRQADLHRHTPPQPAPEHRQPQPQPQPQPEEGPGDSESVEDESLQPSGDSPSSPSSSSSSSSSSPLPQQGAQLLVHPTPRVAHAQGQLLHHSEGSYNTMRKEGLQKFKWNGSVYITLAFAGVALLTALLVGAVLLRRQAQRSPQAQGFVQVDQGALPASPEERHLASMQVNGYENPTYKYFEANTN
ncbi:amyloid-beta-like protein isoform X2 [Ixodes scapularis]|nr:amyloid-beta-like protein isoform X2 [Ixodes scapularis]